MTQSKQSGMSEEIRNKIIEEAENELVEAILQEFKYIGIDTSNWEYEFGDGNFAHEFIAKGVQSHLESLSHPQPSVVGDDVVYRILSKEEEPTSLGYPVEYLYNARIDKWMKPVPLSSLIPARVSEEVKEMEAAEGLIKSLRMEIELDERIHNADLETIKQLRKENDRLQSLIPKHTDSKEQEPK